MVFSTNCEKSNNLGTGYIIPFKSCPIENLDELVCEARKMAKAEGMNCKFIGGLNKIWASMGILINCQKVIKDTSGLILEKWDNDISR